MGSQTCGSGRRWARPARVAVDLAESGGEQPEDYAIAKS